MVGMVARILCTQSPAEDMSENLKSAQACTGIKYIHLRTSMSCPPCVICNLIARDWDVKICPHKNSLTIEVQLRNVLFRCEQNINGLLSCLNIGKSGKRSTPFYMLATRFCTSSPKSPFKHAQVLRFFSMKHAHSRCLASHGYRNEQMGGGEKVGPLSYEGIVPPFLPYAVTKSIAKVSRVPLYTSFVILCFLPSLSIGLSRF